MRRAAILLVAMSILGGCQSAPRPAPGMAALRVYVIAEPKAGQPTAQPQVKTFDTLSQAGYGPFATVDYTDLGQIVVWLEPAGGGRGPMLGAQTIAVDPRRPDDQVNHVATVGQTLMLVNQGTRPATLYSVSDGNEFDFEHVEPGGRREYVVKSPGLIEVLTDSSADPVVQVYAAPTGWVRLTHARQIVDFNQLPPGECKIVSWHPRLPGSETDVVLSPGEVGQANVKVGVNSLPKVR